MLRQVRTTRPTIQGFTELDSVHLHSGLDSLGWKPIIAPPTAKEKRAQEQPDEDSDAEAQKTLTKIHVSKVLQNVLIPLQFVNWTFMIQTRGLEFRYGASETLMRFPDMDCTNIREMLLLGGSGSGKTTLLHLLCGLLRPTAGDVIIQGQSLSQLSGKDLDHFRGKHFGIIFQKSHFVQSLTVMENMALPHFLLGMPFAQDAAMDMLKSIGIGHKAHNKPKDLSVGEQQRASIARALSHQPSLVLADEPTSALDDHSTESVIALLEEKSRAVGATLLIVTHDQRLKDRYDNRMELKPIQVNS